ncbi:hypothetical protein MPTK1_4g21870 [Marchantia polymorpha subsp. ruderalis]|uniref:WRC domain-containing protein n=2 Tax=Marchantia polymorpha TaxID=3197 RepID=A0AAF6BCF5_MARPO|nr:hypothetical protein MARPO_0090s0035 [Marchantia polymorpha]BBN09689.1 hypothetical protein Mp_4g21870 [Marchantia polymorpha subsp. ruderalis]|eukprot:PTQ33298.1 hypothetical protein MARPO_0090s0035 [Marchantia polymorpha]
MAGIPMAPDAPHVQGFWSAVRDVVRCNRKDGKRWQCAREVVPGQKYCERHVGRGRSRPKRSAENYSASSEVAATSSLGAISSISMAVAAGQGGPLHVAYNSIQASTSPNDPRNHHMIPSPAAVMLPSCFEKVARVKVLYDRVRSNFPYFDAFTGKNHPIFMENAGGSQVPRVVIDAISNYMRASYVQVGAGYDLSNRATETIKSAHNHMKTFTNAHGVGEVVFGASTSQMLTNLSYCYSHLLAEGDEIIVHEANHEANSGPWLRMAVRCGLTVKWWRVNYDTFESELEALAALLSPRTRIVAVAHVSNILGEVLDLERVVKLVKTRVGDSVRVVADGVAYAPHRAVDVAKWAVDWYVFSSYKVYGPHMAVLYGSHDAFLDVKDYSPNWDFIGDDDVTKQFELGGPNHEACAGVIALTQYLGVLARVGEAFTLSLEGGGGAGAKEKQEVVACQAEAAGGGGGGGGAGVLMKLEDSSIALAARVDSADASSSPGATADVSMKAFNGDLQPPVSEIFLESMTSSLRDWDLALQGTSFGQEALNFGGKVSTRLDRVVVEAAYDTIVLLEQPLQEKLLAFLRSRQDVIILGPVSSEPEFRVPTISFIHASKRSPQICQELHSANFACRNGHMYCYRLISGLVAHKKLTVNSEEDGVVRISMVHYNTPIEVARLISCLQAIL